jgi:hypothetical protein
MNLSPLAIQKFFDNNGNPLNGGLLFTYVVGTTTKIATYTDSTGATPNTNPVVLDFRGEANVWLDPTLTYKFTLAPVGDTDPPTKPIWTVDHIASSITYDNLTQQIIGQILYPRTAAEIAAGVTPTQYFYPVYHPFRYMTLAQSNDVTARTRAVDVTTALQAWMSLCFVSSYYAELPPGDYAVSAELLLTMSGNRTNQSFALKGAGMYGTRICRIGSQTSMMRFQGTGGPSEVQLVLSGFAVVANEVGAGTILRDCDGITISNAAIWSVSDVRTQYCRYNLLLDGALIGNIQNSNLSDGRIGIKTTNTGAGAFSDCNSIAFSGSVLLKNNLEHGMDIGFASRIDATQGCNIERNGIAAATVTISNASPAVVTYAASGLLVNMPVVFTTTGGLPTGLTAGTTYYVKTVLTANTFTVSATIGGVAINTSSAGSGTQTCTPQTHGIIIRNTCDDLIGTAGVSIIGAWIESNFGGWGIYNEGLTEGVVSVENCELLQQNGIKSLNTRILSIRNIVNSANTNFDLTGDYGQIHNVSINTITDAILYPDYVGFRTATATHANGRVLNYTGTLTDCTTAPTATISSLQWGKTVSLFLNSALTAVSATVAAPTITGMPAAIRPSVTKTGLGANTDASTDKMSQITILNTGVISLANGFSGAFTAAGNKGSQFFRVDYEIA